MRDNDSDNTTNDKDSNPDGTEAPPSSRTVTLSSALSSSSRSSSTEGPTATRKEESGFSFKHFLRNSGDSANSSNGPTPSPLSSTITGALRTNSSASTSSNLPNLGARPKVPQYSLHNGLDQQLPRMKRSPKFPSFDSHASLSEYSEEVSSSFVQRSHSNYEVETPNAANFSRRSPVVVQRDQREPPSQQSSNPLCNSPSGGGSGVGRSASDFQAGLPDFVKDHMVLEQWYQTNPFRSGSQGDANDLSASPPPSGEGHQIDLEPMQRRNYHSSNLFDLAMGSAGGNNSSSSFRLATNNSPTVPLDLPTYDERIQIPLDLPHHRFPSDRLASSNHHPSNNHDHLPLDLTDRHRVNSRNDHRTESPPPQVQADMIQTLPDFLSDGPIHSSGRMADVAQDLPQLDSPEENAAVNVISRLRLENDRLRHELDEARRLISDQGRQINDLERTCRSGEIQRNGTVLERNKLNQKIAQLTVSRREGETGWEHTINDCLLLQEEIGTLKHENESLRDEGGAVGGNSSDKEPAASATGGGSTSRRPSQRMCQMLSMELKLAAGSAEANLR